MKIVRFLLFSSTFLFSCILANTDKKSIFTYIVDKNADDKFCSNGNCCKKSTFVPRKEFLDFFRTTIKNNNSDFKLLNFFHNMHYIDRNS